MSKGPAEKEADWSAEEEDLMVKLRRDGKGWDEISRRLPGRSAESCYLHYQNLPQRRGG